MSSMFSRTGPLLFLTAALVAACFVAPTGAVEVDVADSGWAVSDGAATLPAPLARGAAEGAGIVPPDVLNTMKLPVKQPQRADAPNVSPRAPATPAKLAWRPFRGDTAAPQGTAPDAAGAGAPRDLAHAFSLPGEPAVARRASPRMDEPASLPADTPTALSKGSKTPAPSVAQPAPRGAAKTNQPTTSPTPKAGPGATAGIPPRGAEPDDAPLLTGPDLDGEAEAEAPIEDDPTPVTPPPSLHQHQVDEEAERAREERDNNASGDHHEDASEGAESEDAELEGSEREGAGEQDPAPLRNLTAPPRRAKLELAPRQARPMPTPSKPLTRSELNLQQRLRSVLSFYYRRPLNSVDHDPWEVMHGMLAYGLYSRVQDGGPRGAPITAVGYLCFNKPCKKRQLLYMTPEGTLDVRIGVGLQGHKGQLLALLAQCDVSPDYPLRVEGHEFTLKDLIYAEQLTCYAKTELTFKLIGMMHYLPSDATWVNDQGEKWDIPRLIYEERNQPIRGAACGGTHRLSGLTLAARTRAERGEPVTGEWAEARKFVDQYATYALRLQNPDGSLSTEWFRGPGAEEDIDRRARTTGHILEWLLYHMPDEQLSHPRTVRAVSYLTNLLASNTDNGWEVGPLSHAIHALRMYDERYFVPHERAAERLAQKQGRKQQPVALNYHSIQSDIRESYSALERRHEVAEEQEQSGLGGLFGFGRPANGRAR